jgi:S-(hydroxymethyl)mycothiol dehydrogenase
VVAVPTIGQGVISRAAGEPAQLEEIIIEEPGAGEVLVRIQASGVCHTDLHYKLGAIGNDFPYLLGHEGAGVVVAVGERVAEPQVGDYVVLAWRAPCGYCRFCALGQPNLCAASLNAQPRMTASKDHVQLNPALGIGTFCTHTVVAARQAVKVPVACPPEQASLLGCGVTTGVGAALYTAGVRRGSSVAVFGCGGIGNSVIMGAKLARANRIIGVDIAGNKLDWARQFGATDVVNASRVDPVEAIKQLTNGHGVDFSFEAVGTPQTLLQALWSRDLAGTCTLIGVPDPNMKMELPMLQFFGLGGALRVSWYGDCLPSRDFPLLAEYYLQGQLDLDRMVSRVIKLDETEAAFAAMERGETLRSVIRFPDA